ncbi:probable cytochrome P450 303a1 isoform X2 [Venturia canescens]|uniref:probable cytochrome P450 303a1 isoform X2 n=1 Tax=Venturia canescens TaxID=32260 RepID=UPI001C9D28F2|nr:probable cytochrome P450 303a1 isoform X2 [Venturia canescens]
MNEVNSLDFRMLLPSVLLLILLLLLLYKSSMKPKGYPPGPRWLPILGSALEVARIRKKTGFLHTTCTELSKQYGSVFGLKIGKDRIVVLNNYESMRSMLTNDECDGRPTGPVYEARTWGKRRGVLVTDGVLWTEQRRFLLRHLRDLGFGKNDMATMIQEEASHLVNSLLKRLERNSYVRKTSVNSSNAKNDGRIYRLTKQENPWKKKNLSGSLNVYETTFGAHDKTVNAPKPLKIEDMYVKAEDYDEVRKASNFSEIIIQMDDTFGVPVLNTLWRMMAGKRFTQDDKELINLQKILNKLLRECDMIGAMFGHFPILRYIAPEMCGYKKFMETHQQLWAFLYEELKLHKQKFDPEAPCDLMDAYLKILQSENLNETFSEKQLLAICVDLFMAGSETTTKALNFCFLYLVLYPEVQRKAQEEIDRVIGPDRFPTLADRPRMTYVNAIGLESIRMFMGRTMNIPHRALKDTHIMGYKIPKDSMIVANFNRVLMDESWGDPEVFRPERFIDARGNISVPDQFMPFSIGKHHCMGEVLAKSNIFVFTAGLLQNFVFSVVPGEEKPTPVFTDGVTAGTLPFRVLVSRRL